MDDLRAGGGKARLLLPSFPGSAVFPTESRPKRTRCERSPWRSRRGVLDPFRVSVGTRMSVHRASPDPQHRHRQSQGCRTRTRNWEFMKKMGGFLPECHAGLRRRPRFSFLFDLLAGGKFAFHRRLTFYSSEKQKLVTAEPFLPGRLKEVSEELEERRWNLPAPAGFGGEDTRRL